MKSFMVAHITLLSISLLCCGQICCGQTDAPVSQALIEVTGAGQPPVIGDVTVSVDGKKQALVGWSPVSSSGVQIAVLIDDGLSMGVNQELAALRSFTKELPVGVQIYIGYMSNGSIVQAQGFTTDHEAASQRIRSVHGTSSQSASPYFYLSAFVRQWPADRAHPAARFVMMLTSGYDPYLARLIIDNRNDVYVKSAIDDANAAGVAVSSAYYLDTATNIPRLTNIARSLLSDLSDGTGGHAFQQPNQSTASLAPYLAGFQQSILHTYIATFPAKGNAKGLLDFKADSKTPGVKLRTATQVSAHNVEMTPPIK